VNIAETAGSWRVALRIARRSAWRHKARSVLVLVMLAVPVYAGSVLVTAWSNLGLMADREAEWQLGHADLKVSGTNQAALLAALPAGSRTAPLLTGETIVAAPAGYAVVAYESADLASPLTLGMYVRRAGRLPAATGEVAVTTALASVLGVRPGDHVWAGMPLRPLTMTGVIDLGRSLRVPALVLPANTPMSSSPSRSLLVDLPAEQSAWLPPQSSGAPGADHFSYQKHVPPSVTERALLAAAVTLVVGFAAGQIGLLVGATFAVGARRQRRELGLVGAVGATGKQVRRIVLAAGLVLGAIAAMVGTGLGLVTFRALQSIVERVADHPPSGTSPPWLQLGGVAAFAVAVGLVAALIPARVASRYSIRATLTSRSAPPRSGRWLLLTGLTLIVVGGAAAALSARPTGRPEVIAAAAISVLAGVAACAPALVGGLGRTARLLPLPLRLAVRHAARHRFRTGAAVAVVTVTIAGSVALAFVNGAKEVNATMALGAANQQFELETLPYAQARTGHVILNQAAVELLPAIDIARIAAALPVKQTVELRTATGSAEPAQALQDAEQPGLVAPVSQNRVAIGGPELVRLVAGREATPGERALLAGGGAIAFHPSLANGGTVTLLVDKQRIPLDAVVVPVDRDYSALPGVIVTPATAQRLGLRAEPAGVVFDTTRAPTSADLDAANAIVLRPQAHAAAGTVGAPIALDVAKPPPPAAGPRTETMFYVLAVLSAAVSLLAAAAAVSLATSESRDDLATMVAVGVTPRVRRWMTAAQAAVIVGLGAPLGLAVGIVPAAGLIAYSTSLKWQMPWLPLAASVIAVPLAATVFASLLTKTRPVLNRRIQ